MALLEDGGEGVKVLGDAPRLADDVGERNDLHLAVAPDWDDAAPPGRDQLHRMHAESRRPDPICGRRRTSTLEVTKHRHPGLEARFVLDPPRHRIADAALAELHVPERVPLR